MSFGCCDPTSEARHLVPHSKIRLAEHRGVHKLQARLHEIGFGYMVGLINGVFNKRTEDAVKAFQFQFNEGKVRKTVRGELSELQIHDEKNDGLVIPDINGIFDEATCAALNNWLVNGYYNASINLVRPYGNTWLAVGLIEKLEKLRSRLKDQGVTFPIHFLGGFRHPFRDTSQGMISDSLHCLGSAVDLDEWRGMQNPDSDYYFLQADQVGKWRIWMRRDQELKVETRRFTFFEQGSYTSKDVTGDFIDITGLIEEVGLRRIGRRTNWEKNYYLSEWWHIEDDRDYIGWQNELTKIGYVI